jgi:hypothetical protein
MEDVQKFEQDVAALFKKVETEFPGVTEGMRVLNMSYREYLAILQSSQPTPSITASGTSIP